jgi:hypothetical protein
MKSEILLQFDTCVKNYIFLNIKFGAGPHLRLRFFSKLKRPSPCLRLRIRNTAFSTDVLHRITIRIRIRIHVYRYMRIRVTVALKSKLCQCPVRKS